MVDESDERVPVVVGVAEWAQREADLADALDPPGALERVARAAAEDAGAGKQVWAELDTIALVKVAAWGARNGPRALAERLGARPGREWVSATGGEVGVTLLNRVAREIRAGRSGVALVAGCNNLKTLSRARRQGILPSWVKREDGGGDEPLQVGEERAGSSEREEHYGLRTPPGIYPLFENGLRAHRGLDLETHRRRMGELMSPFTAVAAKNPCAWFPVERSPEELTTVTPQNRMIAFPYPKFLNAVLDTDQAAALLVTSAAAARRLGIPETRWVYWWAGAEDEEKAWYPTERPAFHACEAQAVAIRRALERAGTVLGELAHLDFYSCFPVAVAMACEMLGIDERDPRGFTVTGGLPYAGGPGNNYTLHSAARMVERLRERPGARGLVTGNGWYLTKHSAAVLASAPRETAAPSHEAPEPERAAPVPLADEISGPASVETYTVVYGRDGAPEQGIVVGRHRDGQRFLANTPADRGLLEDLVAQEGVGRPGRVSRVRDRNVFDPT